MKVKNTLKKVGAVAGSALMVGMTMGAAQSLADFPQPFVGDDGTVASQIVVGSQGKVADVVGAVNLAASMGQSTVQTTEQTAAASGGGFGFQATDGASLETRNDNLYFGSNIDDVRQTLTSDHLDALSSTEFEDEDSSTTDVEYFLYPGTQPVQFDQPDTDMDPALNVNNPSSVSSSSYLYQLQANFGQELNFTQTKNQDQDLTLWGTDYTVSQDSTYDELIIFGSSQSLALDAGQSGTVTVNENEHTIELVAVNSGGAAYKVDGGTTQQDTEGSTFTIDGETVRIDNVVNLNDDSGSAAFEVGSDELSLTHGDPIQDSEGDDVEGTYVEFDSDGQSNGRVDDLSTIDLYIGAEDDDMDWVAAGESYSHSMFTAAQFHFGGLAPDAGEGAGANVGEVVFDTAGTDAATVDFTPQGEDGSTSLEFVHGTDDVGSNGNIDTAHLQDTDGGDYVVAENTNATADDYLVTDAGDFSHVFRVTDVDPDGQEPTNIAGTDQAQVDLKPVLSGGSTITVDLDYSGSGVTYEGTEVIDGQEYSFTVNTAETDDDTTDDDNNPDVVSVTWDSGSGFGDVGNFHTAFPSVHLDSGGALALATNATTLASGLDTATDDGVQDYKETVLLPSTAGSANNEVDVWVTDNDDAGTNDNAILTVGGNNATVTAGSSNQLDAVVGQTVYTFTATESGAGTTTLEVAVDGDQTDDDDAVTEWPSALVFEPEDDDSHEHGFIETPTIANADASDAQVEAANGVYLDQSGDAMWSTAGLDSDTDVTEGYTLFGSHTIWDVADQNQFTVHTPDGQAVAGAAFTSAGGDLSSGGGSGSVTYQGLPDDFTFGSLPSMARLDTEVTESVRSNNHLILVGGPAVNTLVSTLVDDGAVDLSDLQGADSGALLQVVQDAFVDGQHALVVAGVAGSDTRAAAKYLGDYADHETALSDAGSSMVLTESDYPSTY